MSGEENRTILVVDDNDTGRFLLSRILTGAGFTVWEASTGREALDKVKDRPSLVILDINLPDIDGLQVCRLIREDPDTSAIPVLHISATFIKGVDRAAGLEGGADGYILQPIEPRELLAQVMALLRMKIAEDRARSEVEHWISTFDAITEAVCLVDEKSVILRCNRSFQETFGVPCTEAIGKTCCDIVHGSGRSVDQCPVRRSKDTGRRERSEWRSGDRWFQLIADPVIDDKTSISGFVHIISDITASKREQEHLIRVNRLYAVLNQINQSIVRIDSKEQLYAEVCRIAVEYGQFVMAWIGIIEEESREIKAVAASGVEKGYTSSIRTTTLDEPEGRGPTGRAFRERKIVICNDMENDEVMAPWRKEAAKRDYRSSAAVPLNGEKEIYGILSLYSSEPGFFDSEEVALLEEMAMDISYALEKIDLDEARRNAEKALKVSEEAFRLAFENARDAILWIDPVEDRIVKSNSAAAKLLERTAEEIEASEPMILISSDNLSHYMKLARVSDLGGAMADFEGGILTSSGKMIPVLISLSSTSIGELRVLQGIFHDLSGQKMLEEQFIQSQKMEAIGRLAGGVAHDFNNLLTAIIGYGNLMLMNIDRSSPVFEDLKEILNASDRASGLTSHLLAFSRKQKLTMKVLNLNFLIAGFEKMLLRLIGEDIKLLSFLDPRIDMIYADHCQIEQVLLNLAVNAREAMPEGGTIVIRTERAVLDEKAARNYTDGRPGSFVCLSIEDTGIGMGEEVMRHIFEPFFTTKESSKGTGLGLSTVYGIVAQHGGWIDVKSAKGRGTTFLVYLPAALKSHDESVDSGDDRSAVKTGKKCRILYVEDDELVRGATTRLLSEHGYTVVSASTGRDGFILFDRAQGDFDLVFSDVVLEDMNGLQLVDMLVQRKPDLKVILTSGYADDKSRESLIRDQERVFLEKPYKPVVLLEIIKQVTEGAAD